MGFDRTQWKKLITLASRKVGMGRGRAWINRMRWIVEKGHCPGTIGTVYRGERSNRLGGRVGVILVIILSDRNNNNIRDRRHRD